MSAPITAQDAESENTNVRLFPERPNAIPAAQFPKRSYAISVMSPYGFAITITLNDMKLDQLDDALATLIERGYAPHAPNPTPAPAAVPSANAEPAVCIYHGPMKESQNRPGTFYCPKKLADGTYCKEKYPK